MGEGKQNAVTEADDAADCKSVGVAEQDVCGEEGWRQLQKIGKVLTLVPR